MIAKRVTKCTASVVGPQSPQLFEASCSGPGDAQIVVVGTGISRRQAVEAALESAYTALAARSAAHLYLEVERQVRQYLPKQSNQPEAGDGLLMFCVLGVSVE